MDGLYGQMFQTDSGGLSSNSSELVECNVCKKTIRVEVVYAETSKRSSRQEHERPVRGVSRGCRQQRPVPAAQAREARGRPGVSLCRLQQGLPQQEQLRQPQEPLSQGPGGGLHRQLDWQYIQCTECSGGQT